jgi:hypothetical protein
MHQESGSAQANPVRRLDPGIFIKRAELREHGLGIGHGTARQPAFCHDGNVIFARCPPLGI